MGLLGIDTYERLEIFGSGTSVSDDGVDTFQVYLRDPEDINESITDFLNTKSEKSFKFACRRLASYGWDPAKNGYAFSLLNATDERNPWWDAAKGRISAFVGPVVIGENEYNGKVRPQVKQVGDESPFRERMGEAEATDMELRLRSRFGLGSAPPAARRKPAPKAAVTTPKSQPVAAGNVDDEDNVPF